MSSAVEPIPVRDVVFRFARRREPEVAAISVPARAYTGDFYFVRRDSTGRLWFILGDVAGKGIDAAVYMAMLQETIESAIGAAGPESGPSGLVAALQSVLCPEFPTNRFVSMIIGTVERDGEAEIVNAGHSPVVVVEPAAASPRLFESTGPVVGILPGARWTSHRTRLHPGTLIVTVSDGVVEAESPDGEEFTMEAAVAAILDARNEAAEAVSRRLVASVTSHRGPLAPHDDTTVLAIRL